LVAAASDRMTPDVVWLIPSCWTVIGDLLPRWTAAASAALGDPH
jgi:hypothetical protein